MKNAIRILLILLFTVCTYAQQGINYKAVIKDGSGNVVVNQNITIQFTISKGPSFGTNKIKLKETHSPTTDVNGIVIVNIGEGTLISGNYLTINWGNDDYYLKVHIDTGSGLTEMGITQFMAVPYALQATNADKATTAVSVGACGLSIGDTHQGGIIFYLDATGCHGLIAAPSDQSTGIQWWNGFNVDTSAYGNGIGSGVGNSQGIRRWQGDCSSCYASELCQDLNLGGEFDWYLPSKYELNLMCENIGQVNALGLGNIGSFSNSVYWSSTEYDNGTVWAQSFFNGDLGTVVKNISNRVRAVRSF